LICIVLFSTSVIYAQEGEPLFAATGQTGSMQQLPTEPQVGTIAYVRTHTVDEIRLVESDGSNNRMLWTHDQSMSEGNNTIWSLAWRPDASELAFASTHESRCSLDHSDIYAVGADGSRYRRLTQGPGCAALANYPQGTVRIPVENNSILGDSIDILLYLQGASSAQRVTLPPGGSAVVTFDNVADFGDGEDGLQVATAISGANRYIHASTAVDVKAGQTVTAGTAYLFTPSNFGFEPRSPSWRNDGSKIAYVFGFNNLYGIAPDPEPLSFGDLLLAETVDLPEMVHHVAYSPTPARAGQLLYQGSEYSVSDDSESHSSIYLVTEASNTIGERLVSHEFTDYILDVEWLPDGSGFIYSVTEGEFFSDERGANLFVYDFASKKTSRLTNFTGEFAGRFSVSPDGQQIVFERADDMAQIGFDLVAPDLWVIHRDGSGLRLLVENGRAPAWSPGPLQSPQQPTSQIFIPFVQR
jgi:TolB protein